MLADDPAAVWLRAVCLRRITASPTGLHRPACAALVHCSGSPAVHLGRQLKEEREEEGSLSAGERKMHTFFRIIDTQTKLHSKAAPLNARELASLRLTLQSAGIHADLDEGEVDGTALNFEYNANAVAIARFAQLFDARLDIVSVIEESQFLGRAIRVRRTDSDAFATLEVSEHIAISPELAVTRRQAELVLDCLDWPRSERRSIPLDELRSRLGAGRTYSRFERHDLGYLFDYLARIADTDCGEQIPELAWV
ncbi:hypothetical protein [Pseudomonas sp.]|uniref:hypothetical protein n=1 Tax=Pseudomonas sp. TaxID=306 RepID=UPI003D128151